MDEHEGEQRRYLVVGNGIRGLKFLKRYIVQDKRVPNEVILSKRFKPPKEDHKLMQLHADISAAKDIVNAFELFMQARLAERTGAVPTGYADW